MALNTVLIVDDSKLARVTLRKKIQALGLHVELAESAEEAYQVLPGINPDIIFMDHLMPDVSGFEATQHIRTMPGFEKTPIVMCSGKEQDGYLEEAKAIGANYVLSKPPVDEELDAVINALTAADSEVAEPGQQAEVPVEATIEQSAATIDLDEIKAICQSMIAEYKTELMGELKDSIANLVSEQVKATAPESAETAPVIDSAEIESLCRSVLAEEKSTIISEVQAALPAPIVPEIPDIDLNAVNKIVEEAMASRMSGIIDDIKAEVAENLKTQIPEEISKHADNSIDQDIQGILDLRINVVLAEKFSEIDEKLEQMESNLTEQMGVLKASSEVMAIDSDLILEKAGGEKGVNQGFAATEGIRSQLDQMIERQEQHTKTLGIAKKISIAAIILSFGAAIGVASSFLQ